MCWCECKNPIKNRLCKNDYVWNSGTCACEINRYLKSSADDLVITCDKITEPTKPTQIIFNDKKLSVK